MEPMTFVQVQYEDVQGGSLQQYNNVSRGSQQELSGTIDQSVNTKRIVVIGPRLHLRRWGEMLIEKKIQNHSSVKKQRAIQSSATTPVGQQETVAEANQYRSNDQQCRQ